MRNQFIYVFGATIFFIISCNNTSTTSADNSSATPIAKVDSNEIQMPEYYDLETSRPVDVTMDSITNQYEDISTNKSLTYYYDGVSHDTFDIHGRIINNAIIFSNGKYAIDETKVKSNIDSFKIRTADMKKKMGAQ